MYTVPYFYECLKTSYLFVMECVIYNHRIPKHNMQEDRCLKRIRSFFPGVKRPGREADHSPLRSAELEKAWIYTSTPSICLHGVVLN
jgi:hypothetical protein